MRRGAALLLAVLLGLLACAPPAGAAEAEPVRPQATLPGRPMGAPGYGSDVPLYDQYPVDAYTVDSAVTPIDPAAKSFHLYTNMLLMTKAWLVKLAIRAAEYAVVGDPLAPVMNSATGAMMRLRRVLWELGGGPMVVAALGLAGLWALLATLGRRRTAALQILGSASLVLVTAYTVLGVAPTLVPSLQEAARAAGTDTFGAVSLVAGTSGPDLIRRAGDTAWEVFVYEPWLQAEFTDRRAAEEYGTPAVPGSDFLAMSPVERVRIYRTHFTSREARDAFFAPWADEMAVGRGLMAAWTLAAAAAFAVPVVLLAGGVMAYQVALLLVVALLPVWLLVALWWPPMALRVLRRVLGAGLAALLLQAVLAVTLGVTLVLAVGAGRILRSLDWPVQGLMLAVLGLMAYRYRLAWLPLGRRAAPAPVEGALQPVEAPPRPRPRPRWVSSGQPAAVGVGAAAEVAYLPEPSYPPGYADLDTAALRGRPEEATSGPAGPAGIRQQFREEMVRVRHQLGVAEHRVEREVVVSQTRSGAAPVFPAAEPARHSTRRPGEGGGTTPDAAQIPRPRPRP